MWGGRSDDASLGGPDVDRHGGDDEHALDDALPVGRDDEDVEAVVEGLDQQQAEGRSPDAAPAAKEAGAADDHRSDGVQLVTLAEVRRAGDDAGGQHDAGQPREDAADGVDA